ncbi:hypothetical protein O181_014617 [Austropuccinia psidii MF-1]|uniref:Uncharacterized protein n=1 Tax=Austropuccinia psidii MF-1 TaxID=1389203 RepID=A0A9Q3C1Z6_9BASI|nr:hypothetical protein [Austropuccinia psidii MF-1]
MFMRWADAEIRKVLGENDKRLQQRIQEEPPQGINPSCNQVPKGLPIDFHDTGWYNNCTPGKKPNIQQKKLGFENTKYKLPEVESDYSENEINSRRADIDEESFLENEYERSDSDTEMAHAGDPGIFEVPKGNAWEGW